MAKIEIKGEVVALLEKQTFSDSQKQTVIVHEIEAGKDGATFENDIAVDFWGDKIQRVENLKEGDKVEISASVRSKEWNERWFTNAFGFFCKTVSSAHDTAHDTAHEGVNEGVNEPNDLPF